jgi:hypothetical protein
VLAVTTELSSTRSIPARFGKIAEQNAHQAAFAWVLLVRNAVWSAADPDGWSRRLASGFTAPMDPNAFADNFDEVRRRFQMMELPDWEGMSAEAKLEASRAQAARNSRSQSTDDPTPQEARTSKRKKTEHPRVGAAFQKMRPIK